MIGLLGMCIVLFYVWPKDPRRAWWFHGVVIMALMALTGARVISLVTIYNITGRIPWFG